MTHTSRKTSSFHSLLTGGFVAVKSSVLGSIFFVLLNLVVLGIISIWQGGIESLRFSGSEFSSILLLIGGFMLVSILYSIVPAFIGGIFLAWLLKRNKSNANQQTTLVGRLRWGSMIGVSEGIVLTVLVLWRLDAFTRTHQGGVHYDLASSLPTYILYAIEIILTATIAGAWVDGQLRKKIDSVRFNTMG